MTGSVKQLLDLFEALAEAEKRSAVFEILRRSPLIEGDLSEPGLDTLADELFQTLDSEESASATES